MKASQCDRVLEVLRDGLPHTIEEIHERAGTMRLNSRVAELRSKRGLIIVCSKQRGHYLYQLLSLPTSAGDCIGPNPDDDHGPAGAGSERGVDEPVATSSAVVTAGEEDAIAAGSPLSRAPRSPLSPPESTVASDGRSSGNGSGGESGMQLSLMEAA